MGCVPLEVGLWQYLLPAPLAASGGLWPPGVGFAAAQWTLQMVVVAARRVSIATLINISRELGEDEEVPDLKSNVCSY